MNEIKPISKFVADEEGACLLSRQRLGVRLPSAAFFDVILKASHRLVIVWVISIFMVGCSLLSPPEGLTPRSFVLTPASGPSPTGRTSSSNIVVGIHAVKMPGYLSRKSFAIRRDNNEIVYLESADWAERLDTSLQRVLAADLARLIPTDQVRLSRWAAETVSVEVDVNVDRFDVDSRGQGSLVAWWLLLSPDGEKVIDSGRFSTTRKGPPPDKDPLGASNLMSHLVSDLAETLAHAIKQPNNPGETVR